MTQHNAIDLDQAAIETALGLSPKNFTDVTAIYLTGGFSIKSSGTARVISSSPYIVTSANATVPPTNPARVFAQT